MRKFNDGDLIIHKGITKGVIHRRGVLGQYGGEYYVILIIEGVRQGTFYQAYAHDLELDKSLIRDNKLNNLGI